MFDSTRKRINRLKEKIFSLFLKISENLLIQIFLSLFSKLYDKKYNKVLWFNWILIILFVVLGCGLEYFGFDFNKESYESLFITMATVLVGLVGFTGIFSVLLYQKIQDKTNLLIELFKESCYNEISILKLYGIKYSYLFSWDEIPGNDSGRHIDFLKQNYSIDWVKTAKIEKIDDDKTIRVYTEKNYLSLTLNDERTKANLKIDDGRTDEFIVRNENRKLNIYNNSTDLETVEKEIKKKIEDLYPKDCMKLEELKDILKQIIETKKHIIYDPSNPSSKDTFLFVLLNLIILMFSIALNGIYLLNDNACLIFDSCSIFFRIFDYCLIFFSIFFWIFDYCSRFDLLIWLKMPLAGLVFGLYLIAFKDLTAILMDVLFKKL